MTDKLFGEPSYKSQSWIIDLDFNNKGENAKECS